jgi:glycosyltransferase involved in cell wall biosynthesis
MIETADATARPRGAASAPTGLGVSIIMPVMDETTSLRQTVRVLLAENAPEIAEILCVTSRFSTAAAIRTCEEIAAELPGIVKVRQQNKPYLGGALQDAFTWAQGEYILLMASDLETDPHTVRRLIDEARSGWDIVATTRWRKGGGFEGYNPAKYVLNWNFQKTIAALYRTRLSDLTYGFRIYRAALLKDIEWRELRHPFLLECVLRPLQAGATATEIPVRWEARREGESHNPFWRNFLYFGIALKVRFGSGHDAATGSKARVADLSSTQG